MLIILPLFLFILQSRSVPMSTPDTTSTVTEIDVLSVSAYGSGMDEWFSAPTPESTSTSSLVLQLTPTSVQTITPSTATDPPNPPPTELPPPPPPTTPDAAPLTEPASPTPARTPPHIRVQMGILTI
ncbi:hypothetical protein DFH09DRAFT_1349030 [Mycena vulgaris]|nr:hypothetical protein DFH09DRAFT_1349030 [Mycena vulgaris]